VRPGAGIGGAVELVPGGLVREPVVRADVDDQRFPLPPVRRGVGYGGGQFTRRPVREREEDHVVAEETVGGSFHEAALGEPPQVRLHAAHDLARIRVRRQRTDLDVRVAGEDPQDLSAGITTCPCHSYRYTHPHKYTPRARPSRTRVQISPREVEEYPS